VTAPIRLFGTVERRTYAAGSKSERPAMIIMTAAGDRYLLRRLGANPYADAELEALDGVMIEATGRIHRDVFLIEEYRIVTE
jgi:hypothetical protein